MKTPRIFAGLVCLILILLLFQYYVWPKPPETSWLYSKILAAVAFFLFIPGMALSGFLNMCGVTSHWLFWPACIFGLVCEFFVVYWVAFGLATVIIKLFHRTKKVDNPTPDLQISNNKKSKVRKIIKIAWWFTAIAVTLSPILLLSVWFIIPSKKPPKDEQLIALFQEHREAFEKIKQMAMEDIQHERYLVMYNLDFPKGNGYQEKSDIPESRQQEYKKMLSRIPLPHDTGLSAYKDGELRFILARDGYTFGPGWSKGIEFYLNGHGNICVIKSNLNEVPSKAEPHTYLRPLDTSTNWFLYYEVFN